MILDENEPSFPFEIKNLNDVPIAWFWAVLKKVSAGKILDETIKSWMKNHTSHSN